MDIILLIAQRRGDYPGQHAPELLDAIDSLGNDENPDYLDRKEQEARNDKQLQTVARLTVRIPAAAVQAILNPPAVEATVLSS